jgi:phage baseplate assembly protein W
MSRADKITPRSKNTEYYSDFLMNFDLNPISGEIARVTNEKAVIRAIKNLINTNRGERPFQPNLGCGIKKLLFEPMDEVTADLIKMEITTTITQYEPRVNLILVDVQPQEQSDAYIVSITFSMVNQPSDALRFSTVLKRVRSRYPLPPAPVISELELRVLPLSHSIA